MSTGIGTDSHGMDIIGELRVTGLLSKQFFGKAHVGTAHQLMRAGTLAGANALGRPDLGRLQAGAKADLLVFDLFKPHLQPVWDPVKNLIWKGHAGDIALIMVHGEPVVRDGRHLKVDEAAIMRNGGRRRAQDLERRRGTRHPAAARGPAMTGHWAECSARIGMSSVRSLRGEQGDRDDVQPVLEVRPEKSSASSCWREKRRTCSTTA